MLLKKIKQFCLQLFTSDISAGCSLNTFLSIQDTILYCFWKVKIPCMLTVHVICADY